MMKLMFDGYCPFRSLVLKDARADVERTHGGFLAVVQGKSGGTWETIPAAIEAAASAAHDCQINVTTTRNWRA